MADQEDHKTTDQEDHTFHDYIKIMTIYRATTDKKQLKIIRKGYLQLKI